MRWGLIASPGEARAEGFCAALAALALPTPVVCPWPMVATDASAAARRLAGCDCIRIDAPGTDAATWSALLGHAPLADTWLPGRLRFAALTRALAELARAWPEPPRYQNHPDDLLLMADKERCRAVLHRAGLPQPQGLASPPDADALIAAMAAARWDAVFIKPRWGAGGAGIIALRRHRDGRRLAAYTTLHGDALRPRIAKRVRRITDTAEIRALADLVLRDGAVVERWVAKRTAGGGPVDLRVLVVAGRARHRIARVGDGPITNLHLRGRRLDAATLWAAAPPGTAERFWDAAERAAAQFPRSAYAGVDLLIDRHWQPLVGEVNGWGDLLPRLRHDGDDTFTAGIRAMTMPPPSRHT